MKKSASCLVLVLFFAFAAVSASAQSDDQKFEVGGHFSIFPVSSRSISVTTLPCIVAPCPTTIVTTHNRVANYGFGGRLGYRLSEYFTLEGEGNYFPRDSVLDGGRKTQVFLGVKAGKRFEHVGVFAKARPGLVHYSRGDYQFAGACIAVFPQPIGCYQPSGTTSFAADVGGVFEYYPSKRTIIRFDAGDTIVRLAPRNVVAFQTNPPTIFSLVVVSVPKSTEHKFQSSIGFGFRF